MLHKEVDLYFIFLQRTVLTEDQHLTAFFPCLHNIPSAADKTVQSMILYDITIIFSAEMVFCYKNCSSERKKIFKFEAEGQEFAKILRSLEQFIQTVKGQNNVW